MRQLLLVEGRDDEHVVKALCGRHGLPKLEIVQHEGYTNLLEALPLRILESDVASLGVIIDADSDPTSRWQSVRDRLEKAGFTDLPKEPALNGGIFSCNDNPILPRVGVWLMPDNQTQGILETFLRHMVPDGDQLFKHAEHSVGTIPDGFRLFREVDQPKALMHTWLAWQDEPGRPLGQSITRRVLSADTPLALSLVDWLRALHFPVS